MSSRHNYIVILVTMFKKITFGSTVTNGLKEQMVFVSVHIVTLLV